MHSEEKRFLVQEKETNGISEIQAWKEVKDLEKSEKAFKILWHEKKALENKYNKLLKEYDSLKGKVFKLRFELDKSKKQGNQKEITTTIKHFNRILNFMEKDKPYTRTDLARELLIKTSEVESWLNLMIKYNIENIEQDGIYYIRK
jgi:hypothetical protein